MRSKTPRPRVLENAYDGRFEVAVDGFPETFDAIFLKIYRSQTGQASLYSSYIIVATASEITWVRYIATRKPRRSSKKERRL